MRTDPPSPAEELHDIASLRHIHTTQGYRDGITVGKTKYIQEGFDEGYSLGGRFGLKIGWIKGVVEGLSFIGVEGLKRDVEAELTMEKVFSKQFFDEKGVWKYSIGEEEEAGMTLDRVVERHPLVEAWMGRVKGEAEKRGLVVSELNDGEDVGKEESQ